MEKLTTKIQFLSNSIANVMQNSGCKVPDYMLKIKKQSKRERKRLEKTVPQRANIAVRNPTKKHKKKPQENGEGAPSAKKQGTKNFGKPANIPVGKPGKAAPGKAKATNKLAKPIVGKAVKENGHTKAAKTSSKPQNFVTAPKKRKSPGASESEPKRKKKTKAQA